MRVAIRHLAVAPSEGSAFSLSWPRQAVLHEHGGQDDVEAGGARRRRSDSNASTTASQPLQRVEADEDVPLRRARQPPNRPAQPRDSAATEPSCRRSPAHQRRVERGCGGDHLASVVVDRKLRANSRQPQPKQSARAGLEVARRVVREKADVVGEYARSRSARTRACGTARGWKRWKRRSRASRRAACAPGRRRGAAAVVHTASPVEYCSTTLSAYSLGAVYASHTSAAARPASAASVAARTRRRRCERAPTALRRSTRCLRARSQSRKSGTQRKGRRPR